MNTENMKIRVPTIAAQAPFVAPQKGQCRVHAVTHKGLVRERNEDQYLVANVTPALRIVDASLSSPKVLFGDAPATLFAVADGMGGHARGDEASARALRTVEAQILAALGRADGPLTLFAQPRAEAPAPGPCDLLHACFVAADTDLNRSTPASEQERAMGTTMTIALLSGSRAYFAHAGDSRAYLFRHGELHPLTRDHSIAGELEESGAIDEAAAAVHPLRHIVTNVVGGGSYGVRPDLFELEVVLGDRILLCTDGVHGLVGKELVGDVLRLERDPRIAAEKLIALALDAGGTDNATALVVALDPLPEAS